MNTSLPRNILLVTVLVGSLVAFVYQSSPSTSSYQGIGLHHHALRASPPTPSSSAVSRHARCVREGGFLKGDWQHDPFAVRPEYIHGNNKWGKEHQVFRTEHPLPDALQGQLGDESTTLIKSSSSNATVAPISSAAFLQEQPQHLPYNQYTWVPHDPDCSLKAFDRALMCRLLREHLQARHLLFVGDSITEQQSMSLLLLMGGPSVSNWGRHPTPFTLCNATGGEGEAGHEAVTLSFLRDDYLNTSAAAPWVQHLHAHKPDLVLFNMGVSAKGREGGGGGDGGEDAGGKEEKGEEWWLQIVRVHEIYTYATFFGPFLRIIFSSQSQQCRPGEAAARAPAQSPAIDQPLLPPRTLPHRRHIFQICPPCKPPLTASFRSSRATRCCPPPPPALSTARPCMAIRAAPSTRSPSRLLASHGNPSQETSRQSFTGISTRNSTLTPSPGCRRKNS